MDKILYTQQSICTRMKWITDLCEIDHKAKLPELFESVDSWEYVALKLYEKATPSEQIELARQCVVVGLNRLANDFVGAMKAELQEMYNESQQ